MSRPSLRKTLSLPCLLSEMRRCFQAINTEMVRGSIWWTIYLQDVKLHYTVHQSGLIAGLFANIVENLPATRVLISESNVS